ncbi:DNA-3-methyladenine glycosylase [Bacillus sp. FJAT-49736]|uniref:DNA-3-methyladenine glycosylase family protein n=1 Tax=Bacillus sp. FJAT-49736 TaxID=2833582 RepID=UPI001BC93C95|nr:DNA-3-methyladenine glycosylase [Bacillus sp. FJAT-49736]MBS4175312.1 DNA-3-methyladenine glycosylase 2 family protein [Bacillus sp. FJAT-49736]
MKWADQETYLDIFPPKEFNFEECLVYLGRSEQEALHQIKNQEVYKLLKINHQLILFKIRKSIHSLRIEFPNGAPSENIRRQVADYVWEWFDLDTDLTNFYIMSQSDKILEPIVQKYSGLRIMGIPDLFEALVWAIIGQQINLTFAYTLKKRFVEQFGESLSFEGEIYWVHPTFQKIASLEVEDLRGLQFTMRKAEYVIGIAEAMTSGELSKEALLKNQDFQAMHKSLTAIRGVGAWTADYVLMKCLHHPAAFPIADVGLHNALRLQLRLNRKPSIEEIREIAINWEGWQAYATFYLWRSLYEQQAI